MSNLLFHTYKGNVTVLYSNNDDGSFETDLLVLHSGGSNHIFFYPVNNLQMSRETFSKLGIAVIRRIPNKQYIRGAISHTDEYLFRVIVNRF